MLVPEVVIASTLNKVLKIVRDNYNAAVTAGHEDRSLLYMLFNGVVLGNYDFYANAKKMIMTTKQDPKHLEVTLSYDQNIQPNSPVVFVQLASDTPNTNDLSIGEGDQEEVVFNNGPSVQDQYIRQYRRGFTTTYRVMIISDNKNEVSVLYNLFRCMIIATTEHLAFEGIQNLKIGGNDLGLQQGLPDKVFIRAITMDFLYEVVTPAAFIQDVFTKIRFIASVDQSADYTIAP